MSSRGFRATYTFDSQGELSLCVCARMHVHVCVLMYSHVHLYGAYMKVEGRSKNKISKSETERERRGDCHGFLTMMMTEKAQLFAVAIAGFCWGLADKKCDV